MDPLALTIPEAAAHIGVSSSTICAMIADGRLRCSRIVGRKGSRGRIVIRAADLDALLNEGNIGKLDLEEIETEIYAEVERANMQLAELDAGQRFRITKITPAELDEIYGPGGFAVAHEKGQTVYRGGPGGRVQS